MGELERFHAETTEEWATWLEANHATSPGVWLVSWRRPTGQPAIPYEEAVIEALRFGWIDSTARRIDEERSMQRYTPRRPGSGWSRLNKRRIERLEQDGRLAEAGRRVIEAAKADGSWSRFDAVEDLLVPDDLDAAFARHAGSRERWEAFPPSARKQMLWWVVQAKRPETRARRVEEIAARAAAGERARG